MSSTPPIKVRIVHETSPEKYYAAVFQLAREGCASIVGAHRYSVVKGWMRAWLKERRPLGERTRIALLDLAFRAKLPFIKDEVVILGFAPWDFRMALYGPLAKRNRVIYHTSWPYWSVDAVPRRYGVFTPLLRRLWLAWLRHPNVSVVCILEATRTELNQRYGIDSTVIGHSVADRFFDARCDRPEAPLLRLIFVGALSDKKGILNTISLINSLGDYPISLTIVGDGPLREKCSSAAKENPAIRYLGPIFDRDALAKEMAAHDILVLLPRRSADWEELFGIVLIEASAAGLGVIASDHIGPRSLLASSELGNLFDENDSSGPLALLRFLSNDRHALAEFKAAHASLSDAYREPAIVEKWRQVINPT